MLVTLAKPATTGDIKQASQDYPNYVKITIDIEKERVVIGGEFHADAEQVLLLEGSDQENIWGGGLELSARSLETLAMINVRARANPHQDIDNQTVKKKFLTIAYKYLKKYAHKPQILL